ncbi:uncharacterized protein LOC119682752 [Teleopsis dalmanni]|uniref:uncharacterized protein LOC119682752 n=1 Tax=Teleopsis dalmanni TaxID=139649 RepID=UPI0018CDA0B3|nr:uncharacterized protein LOC119682752 [Teleopsis dalmanni]
MKVYSIICLISVAFSLHEVVAYKEITGILDNAKDLTPEEINALRPLFNDLQSQYDYIVSMGTDDTNMEELYDATFNEYFASFFESDGETMGYDTSLPTVEELIGESTYFSTLEEQKEMSDLQSILEDTLEEAQTSIDELVKRAITIESQLLKLNKPKIVTYIYKALGVVFKVAVRVSRAAYCTYSHIPQLNTSLHNIYDGIDCYSYTSKLILKVQTQTVNTVLTIRKNVYNLADVYRKVAGKQSLVGKITTIILNVFKILRNIREAYTTATHAMDALQNELPDAALKSVNCGKDFAATIPDTIATVTELTTCIAFVDDSKEDYDFMKPVNQTRINRDIKRK